LNALKLLPLLEAEDAEAGMCTEAEGECDLEKGPAMMFAVPWGGLKMPPSGAEREVRRSKAACVDADDGQCGIL
jgi:hypothetical protein